MSGYVQGEAIKLLREKKGYTQKTLAELLSVSDKAVSKWETCRGLPDVTLLEPLSRALGVSVAELLSGDFAANRNRSANMLRTKFYVCPVCGNVIHASGEGSFSCCGITLPPLEPDEPDDAHAIKLEYIDGERYVSLAHPMDKSHYISFLALLTSDTVQLRKLYPEQEAESRFRASGHGVVYAFCNRHGLFSARV